MCRNQAPAWLKFKMASMLHSLDLAACGSRFPQLHKLKLTKAERKMMKKQSKALHTLKNRAHEVGEISDIPTPYLLVKNGGLMCGVKRQELLNVFDKYGKLEDLIMIPGKSYSYALFDEALSAKEAMQNINGRKFLNQTAPLAGRTFYLAYLSKRPCTELCFSNKSYPPGMILIEDFISECLELELLQCFSSNKEAGSSSEINVTNVQLQAEQQLKHRYVKHYGYEFIYGSNNVDKDTPLPNGIPRECLPVIRKLISLDCVKHEPDQLTINEYQSGQGIPPHVDTHSAFEDGIISLSLGAKVAMDFRHPDGRHVSVLLPRRSVLIMTEECRYAWTHGITPRKYDVVYEGDATSNDDKNSIVEDANSAVQNISPSNAATLLPREVRLSLTFRKVRRTPCNCKYPGNCDSQNYSSGQQVNENHEISNDDGTPTGKCNALPQSEEDAVILEKEHVHNVYESIAEHFSGTRHSPWPKIAAFLKEQPSGSMVADVGCGNGKYLGVNDQLFMLGSDRSQNLAAICRERGHQVIACDILSLPYRSNSFDVCICIAVIHHLSTAARRLAAIKELTRIVRPGGRILISVWALEQDLQEKESKKSREHSGKSTQTGCKSYDGTDASELKDASEIVHTSSTTSKHQNGPTTETETSLQGMHTKTVPQTTSSLQECASNSAVSRDNSHELKVNASRGVFEQQDLLIPWHYRGQKGRINSNTKSACHSDTAKAGQDELELNTAGEGKLPKVFQRFYHVFQEHELEDECTKLDNVSIVRSYYDKGNWCVELQKVRDK